MPNPKSQLFDHLTNSCERKPDYQEKTNAEEMVRYQTTYITIDIWVPKDMRVRGLAKVATGLKPTTSFSLLVAIDFPSV